MIPTLQTIFHDPDNGKFGNCFSAVLASLLHIPIDKVPVFIGDDQIKQANKWLRQFGLAFMLFDDTLDCHLDAYGIEGLYHDVGGNTDRFKDVLHSCVAKDCKEIFDPHPSGAGLTKVHSYGVLISLEPWRAVEAERKIAELEEQLEIERKANVTMAGMLRDVIPVHTAFLESLTPREREVYNLRCAGYMNKEIAGMLKKSKRTVEIQTLSIGEKAKLHGLVWGKCMVKKPVVQP